VSIPNPVAASSSPAATGPEAAAPYVVGDCGHVVRIASGWVVLDVGSGQSPFPRADVLLEKFPDDNVHRAGDAVDAADPRLVIGDACAMPFGDGQFDFVLASHVVEHVEDPVAFCREVVRVGRRGYIETPGWLGDMLLREPFHPWRVRRVRTGLGFARVTRPRPLRIVGDVFYALVYADVAREGHWTPRARSRLGHQALALVSRLTGRMIRSRWLRRWFYTEFEWEGPFPVIIRGQGSSTDRYVP
jgi:Methyltransferase domain